MAASKNTSLKNSLSGLNNGVHLTPTEVTESKDLKLPKIKAALFFRRMNPPKLDMSLNSSKC